jgi:hypothetical protein
MPGETSRAASYAAAANNLRDATRWLLAAAAGAGAALLAGLSLTSIGSLGFSDWPRLVAAGAGLAAALGAVGYMILRTSRLLTDEWFTLAQLQLEQFRQQLRDFSGRHDKEPGTTIDRIYVELNNARDELYGGVAESIEDLSGRLQKANDELREDPSPARLQTAVGLSAAADTLVQAANYSYIRADFAALRMRLAEAGAVFVAGIVVFAFAANPPKPVTAGSAAWHPAIIGAHQQRPAAAAVSPVTWA